MESQTLSCSSTGCKIPILDPGSPSKYAFVAASLGTTIPRRPKSQLQMTTNPVFHIQEQPFSSYHIYVYAIPAHNLLIYPPLTNALRKGQPAIILQSNLPVQPYWLIKRRTASLQLTSTVYCTLFSEL